MKKSLYLRLAASGIIKNKKIYFPYIISCTGMVMMYYIIGFLSVSENIKNIKAGNNLSLILGMGKFVILAFALLFLIYTNSFLTRRRNTEFGLYNILGMEKRGIARIITYESLIVAVSSITSGTILGIIFSKGAEFLLLYITKYDVDYSFSIPPESVIYTITLFAAIFLILYIKSLISLKKSDVLELMNSEKAGEKPVKANFLAAIAGALILAAAYILSVAIKAPLSALYFFLLAVILVIIATYLLFISGSVALCKTLKKNKNYYYKKNHFIAVSSMTYRMKRNGAGLASICILSTMVLVMLASSASLYFGADETMNGRFPVDNQIAIGINKIENLTDDNLNNIYNSYEKVFEKYSVIPKNEQAFTYAEITALKTETGFDIDSTRHINDLVIPDNLRTFYFISETDYNKMSGTEIDVADNEAMVYTLRCTYTEKELNLENIDLKIKGTLNSFPEISTANVALSPSVFVVIDKIEILTGLENLKDKFGENMLSVFSYYGYDTNADKETEIAVFKDLCKSVNEQTVFKNSGGKVYYLSDCLAEQKEDFYSTFGGLFFIGIILSILFVFAMAMIIYYKQISEGYEDRKSFEIMQNVGMSKRDIKKSINSQILTVFFAPLLMAGLHLCFAFPPIWKILQLFYLENLGFVILISAICFVIFGLIYALIYKATAHAYYSIVASESE